MASQIEVQHDLCNRGGYASATASFIRSDRTWEKTGGRIPGNYYTCADQANGLNIFPCTGSEHRGGVLIICICPCHNATAAAIKGGGGL